MITFQNVNENGLPFVGIGLTQDEIAALADPNTRTPIVVNFKRFGNVIVFLAEQSDAVFMDLEHVHMVDVLSPHSK